MRRCALSLYTGRCVAICHAAGLKTRQAPSHAGWRIFVVYIFSRKHDLNRKKLDLGTRHPAPRSTQVRAARYDLAAL